MKNKIKKFSKGNFQVQKPDVILPETHLMLMIGEGEQYQGSFIIKSRTKGDIRGLVYPSSFRMRCIEQGFEGNPVKINYIYDGEGLLPGHVEYGKFSIVCNGGEYEVAYTAIIEKPYVMTSYGKVQNITDFKKLAVMDFSEARKLFRSRNFYEILKYEDQRVYALYYNMRKWALDEQALEEFLVGIKQKERIFLVLSDEEKSYDTLLESTKDVITITKNTWGYLPVNIEVQGEFIEIGRTELTTDDFVGHKYHLEYVIDNEKLHAGRNYGRVTIRTPYEALSFEVEVTQRIAHQEDRRDDEMLKAQILKGYLSYIAGRKEAGEWADDALDLCQELREKDPDNEFYQLLKAHIYIVGGRKEEAQWVLDSYDYNRFAIGKSPEINCYYLFLTALLREEGSHVNRVIEELDKAYTKNADSWTILYMLVQLDPKYKNYSERVRVLEQQYNKGTNQVMFYLETFLCYREKVTLLKKLGVFEMQIMNFATKYRLITKELALYMANLASQQKTFNKQLFHVLTRAYTLYSEPMILNAICTLLIKGNQSQPQFFKWYQKAVEAELKIAQLYEFYMMTINDTRVREALPRTVYLYFMHGNTLDYKKTAFLYANLITYEDETSDVYAHYRDEIGRFAWEQLEKRHVNDHLRIIYKRFCREEELTPERVKAFYDVCHAYLITTKSKLMKYVLVIDKAGTITQRVAYTEEGAQVFLYDKESRIVWEAKDGTHYVDSIPYESKRLLFELRYMDLCKKYAIITEVSEQEEEAPELDFENLQKYGVENFDEQEVFVLCSKKIREDNYEENDFLNDVCYYLFERGQYDKALLTYLANYYCGATREMKKLWNIARTYEVNTHKLAERLITQMLFTEMMFAEEEIFADYYDGGAYFRLKQAYFAYVSKEYVVHERQLKECIFELLSREFANGEELADICKLAVLKHYSKYGYREAQSLMLKCFLQECCEKQLILPFFLNYKESWLREVQLYDKVIVGYKAKYGTKVKIVYKIKQDSAEEEVSYQTEILSPVYENLYIKQFVLYEDEYLRYYFKETCDDGTIISEKTTARQERIVCPTGKYGHLNAMIQMADADKEEAVKAFQQEEMLARHMFCVE